MGITICRIKFCNDEEEIIDDYSDTISFPSLSDAVSIIITDNSQPFAIS